MSQTGKCTAEVLSEGRITISAPVRRQLGIDRGDLVRVTVKPVGGVESHD